MKLLILLLSGFFSPLVYAAACCTGGSPKSFISLSRLQNHEMGISSTFRDVYGFFNAFGERESTQKNQTLSLTLGAGTRLTQDLQVSGILPLMRQVTGVNTQPRQGIGDLTLSAQYTAIESLFASDWYPTMHLIGGVKIPTGLEERKEGKFLLPGTGNGKWEPFAGVALQKNYGPITLGLRASYTARLKHRNIDSGDAIELIESMSYLFHEQLSLAVGSSQTWTFDDQIDGMLRPDTATRTASIFVSPMYFLNRYWSISASFDYSLPMERMGVNSQAARVISFTTRYGFY